MGKETQDEILNIPQVTIYLYSCKVLINNKWYGNVRSGTTYSFTLPKNTCDITIQCMESDSGYVSWDLYDCAKIISSAGTYVTSEIGWVPDNHDYEEVACKLRILNSDKYSRLNIAIYPSNYTVAWIKPDSTVKYMSFGTATSNFEMVYNNDLSKNNYYPQFLPYNAPKESRKIFDVIPAKDSYTEADMVYNSAINKPYPDKVNTNGFKVRSTWAKGKSVNVITFNGGTKFHTVAYPRWILIKAKSASDKSTYEVPNYESYIASVIDGTYSPRTAAPAKDNPYYIQKGKKVGKVTGYNPCILGNNTNGLRPTPYSVLPNCVGYATGRFNEIGGYGSCKYGPAGHAVTFWNWAKNHGLTRSQTPSLGAIMVWAKNTNKNGTPGHVAIVEKIHSATKIDISESGWSYYTLKPPVVFRYRKNITKDSGTKGNWGKNATYTFLGFIVNPATKYSVVRDQDTGTPASDNNVDPWSWDYNWNPYDYINQSAGSETPTTQIKIEKELIGSVSDIHGLNLLSTPTLVESPFIEARIGNYVFGSYTQKGVGSDVTSQRKVTFPNFMDSLEITKVNGAVNQYVLSMNYQIQVGEDPNLIDKVFSSVANSRKITLTYGDWNAPSFIYRNEDAIITKVTSNVDFAQSRIRYVVYCTSTALATKSKLYDFPAANKKPSDIIRDYVENNKFGLLDLFYGMRADIKKALSMIASDDKKVDIKPQNHVDILTYLNFLVACMVSNSDSSSTVKNCMYNLVLKDDVTGELPGPYFKVVKTDVSAKSLISSNVYEVDVGYPGDTLVTNFSLNNDNSWAILYNYAEELNTDEYVYKIDNNGNWYTEYSPNIMTSDRYKQMTEANRTWWTKMTQFPITATLTIKGLLRPAMLMENVKINAYFYGQRHISSGLYVITRQQDSLNSSGYRTTLSLTRIAGDEDKLYNIKQTEVKANNSSSTGKSVNEVAADVRTNALEEAKPYYLAGDTAKVTEIALRIGVNPAQFAGWIANQISGSSGGTTISGKQSSRIDVNMMS